ncbi:MAG TPA: radical SAM protein [Vicinamibacterales bacterium]|nr:radical SAM protein [Vicinamibacterales bacterium]
MDLQSGIVYGPVSSRRLGRSLGINLAPPERKTCNFNCAYCQYGWTDFPAKGTFPRPCDVIDAVDRALEQNPDVDSITVAGNGEPTLHPGFAPIVEGLYHVRNRRAPKAKLTLLSNGSTLNRLDVVYSLPRFDTRCMKLDAGDATTFRLMNAASISLGRLIADLRSIGQLTLQSMFVRDVDGIVDNTTPRAVNAWLEAVDRVRPASVDVYSLARPPARGTLLRVPPSVLEDIAQRVTELGIPARIFA